MGVDGVCFGCMLLCGFNGLILLVIDGGAFMDKGEKLQIRVSKEMLRFLRENTDNVSRFIRETLRERFEGNRRLSKKFSMVEIRARTPYIYFAKLVRVVDGDTLLLNIDLGFFVGVNERIRLMGVNCEPLDTNAGKKASKFIEEELTDANILVEVKKVEKFGRFLGLVYYSKEYKDYEDIVRNGLLLNEVLLDKGLAVRWRL